MTAITMLGPQRRPTVDRVLRSLNVHGTVAAVTAGWQERESDDGELVSLLGGDVVNLRLWGRWMDILHEDVEFARAEREHRVVLDDLQQLYVVRLDHALRATTEVATRTDVNPRVTERALEDSLELVRVIDRTHLLRLRELNDAFYAAWQPHERETIARHREEVRSLLAAVECLVMTGGHVGELARVLHLFNIAPQLPSRVVAWSAGAMVLTPRIVLFHDRAAHGRSQTEIYDEGIGAVGDVVVLPHARRRLRTDDAVRMSVLARRFEPARCVLLDDGVTVDFGADGKLTADARIVDAAGRIVEVNVA